jgi:hypothetical protein
LKKIIISIIAALVIVPLLSSVYAESIYDINIPSGSADPNAPFHWVSEKDGDTSGFIEIIVDDVIHWKNGDTVAHTVTAGSAADGPSGLFDSSLIMAGKTFSHKFESSGEFPYHCIVHPWMEGIVTVIDGSINTDPPITVKTNSNHYNEGDIIYVTGEVSEILFGYAISLMMIAPNGDAILIDQVIVRSDKTFGTELGAGGSRMKDDGVYTIRVLYGTQNRTAEITFTFTSIDVTPPKILQPTDIEVDAETHDGVTMVTFDVLVIDDTDKIIQPTCKPRSGYFFGVGDTRVTCTARDSAGNFANPVSFTVTVNPPGILIPSWVKNVAEFWCEDKIDDSAFVEGIQYLIDNGIIVVPSTSLSYGGSQEVPQWVKNNACWWSTGLVTDEDFASGIEYLVGQGIIRV